jgi:peptidoglycan/LPS O-acetylase OafA/YrhL
VIVYHFSPDLAPFGYLGVDLFFVISGYLITKQLLKSFSNEKKIFKRFYFKRFKRIIPSLITSSIFTVIIGYYNLSLEHFYELLRGLKYSLLFAGNIYFSQVIDYFSVDSEKNLIINLWSLGVEEQFYILFPFLFLLGHRLKRIKFSYFLLFCFLISLFGYSNIFYNTLNLNKIFFEFEKYLFYSPFTRAAQLLLGSLAATKKSNISLKSPYLNYFLIAVLSLFLFGDINFYSHVLVSLITVFLVVSETKFDDTIISKFFVHLGNLSYSLYLFHQPILAGIRNHNQHVVEQNSTYIDLSKMVNLMSVILIIYLISFVNYKFVEERYRNINTFSLNNFKFVFVGFLIVIFFGLNFNLTSQIYSSNAFQIQPMDTELNFKPGTNYLRDLENQLCIDKDSIETTCNFGVGKKEIYILGDSTISSLVSALLTEDNLSEYKIFEYTKAGCYPVQNICNFYEGSRFYSDVYNIENSTILIGGSFNIENESIYELNQVINKLMTKGNKILFLGYIPSPKVDEAMYYKKNSSFLKSFNYEHFIDEENSSLEFKNLIQSQKFSSNELFNFIDIFAAFCVQDQCMYFDEENSLYIDGFHLSYFGAKRVYEKTNLIKLLESK